ncbi:uncharacterized protein LOC144861749 isoform X2 [Branchiostoma floridae x Branchiostoma japonicum]
MSLRVLAFGVALTCVARFSTGVVDVTITSNCPVFDPSGDTRLYCYYTGTLLKQNNYEFGVEVDTGSGTVFTPQRGSGPVTGGYRVTFLTAASDSRVGVFSCQVQTTDGTQTEKAITFKMKREADVWPVAFTVTANIGDYVPLQMVQKSSRTGTLEWRKGGTTGSGGSVVTDGQNDLTHTIANVQTTDEGFYECHYSGDSDRKQGIMRLIVRACAENKWGPPSCSSDCPMCYNGGVCDDNTGECVCPPGFNATNCETVCPDGMYGAGCSQICNCASGPADCDKKTGACTGGCLVPWAGDSCQIGPDYLGYFTRTVNKGFNRNNDETIDDISPGECARHCLQGTPTVPLGQCQSFDYFNDGSSVQCVLSKRNKDDSHSTAYLVSDSRFDYYHRNDFGPCSSFPCMNGGTCNEESSGHTCTCTDEWAGVNCEDINECTLGTDNCHAEATCSNTVGSFTCTCTTGYTGDGETCTDIDECILDTDNCHDQARCTNTDGSFSCTCNTGYTGDGVTCTDINECTAGTDNCHAQATCSNTVGSFSCSCNTGYTGDGVTCTDIDECTADTDNCHAQATCTNTVGSFSCACNAGYTGDGVTCTDINECTDNTDDCHQNAECTNTAGSFTCACRDDYYGSGTSCTACGQCIGGAACNTVTGVCSSCQPPWTGQLCQEIPAEVTNDPQDVRESLNQPATFTCAGRGEPMPTVTWHHGSDDVTGGGRITISTPTNVAQNTFTSTLSFSSVQRADNGQYTCTAETDGLTTDTSQPATLTVLENPEQITVNVAPTSSSLQATVTVGFTGNLDITAIQVRYRRTEESTWGTWSPVVVTGTQGTFDITGLTPATDYTGEVKAQNSEGWSQAIQFTWRTRDAPPGPPSNIQAPSVSHHTIDLTWQEPAVTNGVITNYYIQYGPSTECSDAQLSQGWNTTDSTTSGTFSGLIPYTTYSFRVRAYTFAASGDYTDCLTAKTTEFTPTEPLSVELADINPCNCDTDNKPRTIELQARWRRPDHVYGELRGYNLKLQQQGSVIYEHNITQGLGDDQLTHTVSGDVAALEPAQRYYLKVSAYNDVYVGEVRSSTESQTSDGCPTAPLVSMMTQEGVCGVTWTEPSHDKGNITGYSVVVSATKLGTDTPLEPVSTSEVTDKTWAASLDDLPAYSSVHVTVRAKTCAEGESTEEVTCTVERIESPNTIPNVTVEDSSVTSSSFSIMLPNISQRNGPISCYQVIIVPMGKGETLDELTVRVGHPQKVLTSSAPLNGRTEPYIALAFSGSSYKEERVTIGTGEPCTEPCCRVGSEEGAQEPGNKPLTPGSTYTATVRAYVDLSGQEDLREKAVSRAQTSSLFMEPIITVLEEALPLVAIIVAAVAAVVASFAAGAGFMFYRRMYINIKKETTTGRTDVPLSDITCKEDSEVEGVDNEALSVSETDSKCHRRLSEIRTVDDVTTYMKENKFGEYAKAFRDHEVDGDALKYLDDAILKDLIPKAGPRAKFKGILAEFKREKPSEVSEVTSLNFWEIPRAALKLGRRLGSGQFGEVRLGELRNRGVTTTVAVKTLRDSASDSDKKDLLGELEILVTVDRHDNIISLVGACTRDGPLMIVVEYAPHGCLKDWLKTNSVENNVESAYQNQPVFASQLPMEQLIQFGVDVANGMSHLAALQCVHRDLAARNILLGENLIAKVSDFGLSRDIYEDSEYVKSTQSKLPLRWMAYESLFYNVYTSQSDVWSFGVLLWEIMAMGNLPYEGMKGKRMMDMIKDGGRLQKPSSCPEELYALMTRCWETLPEDRPTFPELKSSLIRIMQGFKTFLK